MATSGLFITLEGGEGAGKSYQLDELSRRLQERGLPAVCTREPGGTPLGERLREIVLDLGEGGTMIDPLTETLLFIAARAELVADIISPALERGDIVVCDRFSDSTRAYQGFGRGVDLTAIGQLNAVATRGLQPDLTVLLDVLPEEGLARASDANDRFGREDEAFHERVREGYRALAAQEPERWFVVDSSQSPDLVSEAIWRRLDVLLESRD